MECPLLTHLAIHIQGLVVMAALTMNIQRKLVVVALARLILVIVVLRHIAHRVRDVIICGS
jgi:hypothetical protein